MASLERGENTLAAYRRDLAQLGAFLKGRALEEAGEADLFSFLAARKGRASSAARMLSSLKRFYGWCLRERRIDGPVIMISGHGTVETAMRATKLALWGALEAGLTDACRAGARTAFCYGNDRNEITDWGWCQNQPDKMWTSPHPVGQRKPNNWGLFDMHGNAFEWVEDAWHDNYENSPTDGSV